MSELKVGDSFPEGVVFTYVPPAPETKEVTQCGIPVKYDASKGMLIAIVVSCFMARDEQLGATR